MNGDDMKNMEDMLRRHLGVLSEDFQHKLSVVAEGQQMLVERIDRMEHGMNTRMDTLDRNIIRVDVKIGAVEDRLNKKIDTVEERLNKKIDAVDKKVDTVEERLHKKIDSIDEKLSKKIDAVAADLAAHRADTESHRRNYRVSE